MERMKEKFPLYDKMPDDVRTLTGKRISDITLEGILSGEITEKDLRISPKTLNTQAEIAEDSGRWFVSDAFRRAAELCGVPDEKVIQIYIDLRPYHSTEEELEAIAVDLETNYDAGINAKLIRDAKKAYKERGLLAKR